MARKYLRMEDLTTNLQEVLLGKVTVMANGHLISNKTGNKLLLSDKEQIEQWFVAKSTPSPEPAPVSTTSFVSTKEYLIVPNSTGVKGTAKYSTAIWLDIICKYNSNQVDIALLSKVLKALYLVQSHKKALTYKRVKWLEESIDKVGLNADFRERLLGVISK